MVCSTAFFVHEFVPVNSSEYVEIVQKHSDLKSLRSNARKNVLDSQKGTELYLKYADIQKETDIVWSQVLEYQSKEKFLAFKSFQQFLGEFGWALGLFIYSLFNIVLAQIKNGKTKEGETILHSTLMFISLYFINWATMPNDYQKSTYLFFALAMCVLIAFATHILIKIKLNHLNHLKTIIRNFFTFIYKESKEKDFINSNKSDAYWKRVLELTNKTVGNE